VWSAWLLLCLLPAVLARACSAAVLVYRTGTIELRACTARTQDTTEARQAGTPRRTCAPCDRPLTICYKDTPTASGAGAGGVRPVGRLMAWHVRTVRTIRSVSDVPCGNRSGIGGTNRNRPHASAVSPAVGRDNKKRKKMRVPPPFSPLASLALFLYIHSASRGTQRRSSLLPSEGGAPRVRHEHQCSRAQTVLYTSSTKRRPWFCE
jgi:hypothetical protein